MKLPRSDPAGGRTLVSSTWCRCRWTSAHLTVAVALVAGAVLVTLDAWKDIVHIATVDDDASHVFLVPFVAVWLVWVRRERLRNHVRRAMWAGPALVAAGWALNHVGDRYLVESFWHLGAVVIAVGAFVSVAGGGVLVRFLPAFASLVFLVPVPGTIREAVAIPLQSATAAVTQTVLETLGVAVGRSGNMLTINEQDVMIADACNGLRMVFALVMVSYAFAFGVPLRNRLRVVVVVLSPVLAIAFNVVRLVPVVWAYGLVGSQTGDVLHEVSGWVMLPCAFLSLLGVMRIVRWAQVPVTPYVLAYGS